MRFSHLVSLNEGCVQLSQLFPSSFTLLDEHQHGSVPLDRDVFS